MKYGVVNLVGCDFCLACIVDQSRGQNANNAQPLSAWREHDSDTQKNIVDDLLFPQLIDDELSSW